MTTIQEHNNLKKELEAKGLKIICEICLACEHPNGFKEGCSKMFHEGYMFGFERGKSN